MPPGILSVKPISRFVSMRVHEMSAHINPGPPPDLSSKVLTVEHLGTGTYVSANWQFSISAHLAIPTPLQVEDAYISFGVPGGHPDPEAFQV